MANIVFDDIEGDDNIIPLYSDGQWNHTSGVIYSRMPFFASLGFTCRSNNRLIKSYSDGSFETTAYANELISNSILTFIFVFNHEETYVNFSDVRAITNISGGLQLSQRYGYQSDSIDIGGTVVNLAGNSIMNPKFTIKRGIVINKKFTGLGIVLNGQNLSNSYETSITGGTLGGFNSIDRSHACLIPQYL